MRGRTWSRAAMLGLALALPLAPVVTTTASAETASVAQVASHGDGKDDRAEKGKKKQKGKKAKKASAKFNLGGRLTAVDAEAGTVTFRVHGGKIKSVRGTELTVVVGEDARVRRNDAAATLADFQVGDKVRAKGTRADGVWTASRVKAEAPDFVDDGDSADDDSGDDSGGSADD